MACCATSKAEIHPKWASTQDRGWGGTAGTDPRTALKAPDPSFSSSDSSWMTNAWQPTSPAS